MRLLTREQARELDSLTMDELEISGQILMGNAGKQVASTAKTMVGEIHEPRILIICGKGNNGGDGFAAAAELFADGFRVTIHSLPGEQDITGDALYYYQQCADLNIPISHGYDIPELDEADLIMDALLGTGFHGPMKADLIPWVEWINSAKTRVQAVDISSGLDSNSGLVQRGAVKADTTVTMGAPKVGMVFRHGKEYTGVCVTADIGFPKLDDITLSGLDWELFHESAAIEFLRIPEADTHKYQQGKVLVIAGSTGMTGAAVLATMGALRSGTGLTITTVPESLNAIFEADIIEGMTLALPDHNSGCLLAENLDDILDKSTWADAVVLGPGLGRNKSTQLLVRELVRRVTTPMVLDADGLFPFARNIAELNQRQYPLVITPHIGELASLTAIDKEEIKNDFPNVITEVMADFHHIALVKQVPVCIFSGQRALLNCSGNPGLSTAGTGDVLSGMIGSFLAGGLEPELAAALGAFIHGKSSDQLVEKMGYRGQIASDLLPMIPHVLATYEHL